MRGKPAVDETGARYGRLVVLCRGEPYRSAFKWKCVCDCGNEHQVSAANLRTGQVKSCGKCGAFLLKGDEAACRQAHNSYRTHAKRRGYEFGLSVDEFREIASQPCHYCGTPPGNTHNPARARSGAEPFVYSGIDRQDNSVGYTKENVVPCCHTCNRAKSDMHLDDFLAWIARLKKMN